MHNITVKQFIEFLPRPRTRIDLTGIPAYQSDDSLLAFAASNPTIAGYRTYETEVLYIDGRKIGIPNPNKSARKNVSPYTYFGRVLTLNDLKRTDIYAPIKYGWMTSTHVVDIGFGDYRTLDKGDKVYDRDGNLLFEMSSDFTGLATALGPKGMAEQNAALTTAIP